MDARQCRMARTGLGWRAKDLADAAGVGTATIARFELGETINTQSRQRIAEALEAAGARFGKRVGQVSVSVPDD